MHIIVMELIYLRCSQSSFVWMERVARNAYTYTSITINCTYRNLIYAITAYCIVYIFLLLKNTSFPKNNNFNAN